MCTHEDYTDEQCKDAVWAVGCTYEYTQGWSGDGFSFRVRDMAKVAKDDGRFSRVVTWEDFCLLCDRLGIPRFCGRHHFNRPEAVPHLQSHGYEVVG